MALAPDANSQELDGRALYTIGRGMKHGRVPIGDGAVDKTTVLAHSKSVSVRPPDPDHYESVLQENAQLKTNNDILAEENRVHRELFIVIIFPLFLQLLCPKNTISSGYTFNCRVCLIGLE